MQVNFLDHKKQETQELLNEQLKAFIDFNQGSQIAFMETGKIEAFVQNYVQYFNTTLKLTDKEIEEARKRTRADGYFGDEDNREVDFTENAETGLVFFNPKSGFEMALNFNDVLTF